MLFFNRKPVKACGLILVHYSDEPYFLLQKKKNRYEDFGGRVDPSDQTVFDTITREATEESNGQLDRESLLQRLFTSTVFYYHQQANYLYAILPATAEEASLIDSDFGSIEAHDQIERQVSWVPLSQLSPDKIHPRLLGSIMVKNESKSKSVKKQSYKIIRY